MKKSVIIIVCLLFLTGYGIAQKDSVQARIILIGDAGSLKNGKHPVVNGVRKTIQLDSLTTILYLGDNLYTYGLPDDAYSEYNTATAILDSQINIAQNTAAKVLFIPGNHDWNHEGRDGWNTVMREQQYIDQHGGNNVSFYPKDGCPGPVQINLSKDVLLILLDTQWWLHLYDKPGVESDCPYKTKDEILNELDNIVSKNSKKLILFASHHPFKSNGIHGGYYTLKQHLFPLTDLNPNMYIPMPLVGSIYPITRGVFGTPQDLKHPTYQNMVNDLEKVLKHHPNVIFLAGHEHNLQLIKDSSYNYIISGSGTNKTRVSKSKKELYGAEENGFVTLEILENKNANVSFYTVKDDSVKKTFTSTLLNFSKLPKTDSSTSRTPTVTAIPVPFEDSVIVSASEKYEAASGLQRFILGTNYRKEWSAKVKMKVFDISKEKGGMTILSLGGGKQTTSLRLKDKDGKEWTLRTIDKNPEKAIPEMLRGSIAQDIVEDMISASHPYASLSIPDLAQAVHVVAANPKFYFVPDDPALGVYRSRVANTLCLLEEREPTPDESSTKTTQKVISKLLEDNDNRIDQPQVLRARLLDMLIGDWDRHFDQWRWGTRDTGKGKVYYAIPRDRDQAFFYSDGLLIKGVSKNLFQYLKGFTKNIASVNWLNWEERDLDRFFLNRLDKKTWANVIDTFQHDISDSVIVAAVNKMPPEIVAIDGTDIINKLKSRRDAMMKEGLKYYKFLSNIVTVVGTNDKEYFKVSSVADSLRVTVYKRKKDLELSSVMYDRTFSDADTKEILLYGLNDNDYFDIAPEAKSRIKIRIIGGKGNDTFNIQGHVRNYLYDLNTKENHIINHNDSKILTSSDPHVNDYSTIAYKYNTLKFPRLLIGYNQDDKFLLGTGIVKRTYGFRKEPYSTEQKLSALYAFNRGSYRINYQGEFNHALGNTDLLVNASLVNPVLNNFFGFGNETVIDKTQHPDFYTVRYKYLDGEVLFRKRFNNILHISGGPVFNHYWDKYENNKDRILGKPGLLGLDSSNVYERKTYMGGKLLILVNNLDNVLMPTRGINWTTEFTALGGLTPGSKPFTSIRSDMAIHASLSDPARLVTVVRIGGGHIFSKNYEYFQTMNLGANNFLRGFRKNRFSGTSLFYASVELRVKLFESKSYLLPGAVGLIGFNEIGKVWLKGEKSSIWHDSYGGGFYYAAYNFALVSATIGYSKEDKIFNFSIGTKFNITF